MNKLTTFAACVLLTSTMTNALAEDKSDAKKEQIAKVPTFSQIDGDNDGFISLEESQSLKGLMSFFSELDTNKDERLSRVEFLKFNAKNNS